MSSRSQPLWLITALLLLCSLITFSAFTLYPAYRVIGEQHLQDTDFAKPLAQSGWQMNREYGFTLTDSGQLQLSSTDPSEILIVEQHYRIQPEDKLLRAEASFALENVVQGSKGWYSANAELGFYRGKKKLGAKTLFNSSGTHGLTPSEKVIPIDPRADSVRLSFRLFRTTGTLIIEQPALYTVQEANYFGLLRGVLAALWLLLSGYAVYRFVRSERISLGNKLLATATGFSLVVLLTLPVNWLDQPLIWLTRALPDGLDQAVASILRFTGHHQVIGSGSELRKLGHGVSFALLGLVVTLQVSRQSLLAAWLFLLALIPASETIQLFFSARSASVADLFIDSIGLIIGVGIALLLRPLLHHFRKPKEPSQP